MAKDNKGVEAAGVGGPRPVCGIVRPIAAIGDYEASHWSDVGRILEDAAGQAGYDARLVSDSASSNIILQEIVTNLFQDAVVICDVSARNPNVMFELGLRMAFQKPVVVICDFDTPFSFDITVVKHIQYPRTLRYADILKFKDQLAAALQAAVEAGNTYLQRFGPITATALGERSVGVEDILQELVHLRASMSEVKSYTRPRPVWEAGPGLNLGKQKIRARSYPERIVTDNINIEKISDFLSQNNIRFNVTKGEGDTVVAKIISFPVSFDPVAFQALIGAIDPQAIVDFSA